jgi:hypothetical protein
MDNTITGRIIAIMDERSGISKNGSNWREREYVIETDGQYPKKCAFKVKGDNIGKFNIQFGETITAHLDINAHDWQGKWFNEVTAWKVEKTA